MVNTLINTHWFCDGFQLTVQCQSTESHWENKNIIQNACLLNRIKEQSSTKQTWILIFVLSSSYMNEYEIF